MQDRKVAFICQKIIRNAFLRPWCFHVSGPVCSPSTPQRLRKAQANGTSSYAPGNEGTAAAAGAEPRPAAVPALPPPAHATPAHRGWLAAQTPRWPRLLAGRERAAGTGYKHVLKIKCLASIWSLEPDNRAIKLREHFVVF